ncbi:hypothetical protein DRW71_09525 [Salmonella enterica subsp. diarizonae]|nr:hypothetical protein [Salmonella enterica subsp. diarizonae]EGO4916049.1 DUF957 domain-containing protein [Salmonella enterica]EIG1170847.1 hypothetical protein [Salmonella enterica subsp. diarizonae serovar 48:k:z53]ECJ5901102.1 DUF957 domain-containing protein [Salmonella enterica subsp. diarizonae]EHD7150451.1 DUF957 domain-containing protein [Salmonella enterica]
MSKKHKLEILLAWLEDSIECGTAIEFTDGVDSTAILPAVRGAVELLNMPKAKRNAAPWGKYWHTEAAPSLEMRKDEAEVWNEAHRYVMNKLKGDAK